MWYVNFISIKLLKNFRQFSGVINFVLFFHSANEKKLRCTRSIVLFLLIYSYKILPLGYLYSLVIIIFLLVSSAKLKRKKNWFGTAIYTEVVVDGEIKKTAKSSSSSNPKWDEQLTV